MRFFVGMLSHETSTCGTIPIDRGQGEARRHGEARHMTGALAAVLVFTAGAVVGAAALAWAQAAAPRMSAQVLLDLVTTELGWARTNVRAHLDAWEPGAETGRHDHPGPALLYVLEGRLEETTDTGVRTLNAGQVVWNPGKTPHNVRNRAERPARALAIHLDPGR